MTSLLRRRKPPEPKEPGLQRKVSPQRAEQIGSVARFELALLAHRWDWRTHAGDYEAFRAGQKGWDEIHELAARCARCGMRAPALSAWRDIAPDDEHIPGCLLTPDPEP